MERKIVFRGKNRYRKEWLYGNLSQYGDGSFGIDGVPVETDSVGQFTGLLDKNGKEIYEGDVILQQGYSGKKAMLVRFEQGAFIVGWHGGSSTATRPMLIQKRCEVLGNIHDTPSLISDKK